MILQLVEDIIFFLSNILQNYEDDGEGKPVLELWVQAVHAATLQ